MLLLLIGSSVATARLPDAAVTSGEWWWAVEEHVGGQDYDTACVLVDCTSAREEQAPLPPVLALDSDAAVAAGYVLSAALRNLEDLEAPHGVLWALIDTILT